MKKIVLLLMAIVFAYITEAQKAGTLKINHYNVFDGGQWESFLNGENAVLFEKYSNVKLSDFLEKQVTPYVQQQLKEQSIASAMDNSTMESFPDGVDVMTMNTAGEWKPRKVRPGESGFFHHPTGKYWISFSCGNLMDFGPGPKTNSYAGSNVPKPPTVPNSNTNLNTNVFSNEISWIAGYGIYSQGRNDRSADLSDDFLMAIALQKASGSNSNCCPTTNNAAVAYQQPVAMYVQPTTYAQAPQNGSLDVNVRNKPNALDYINTAANVANATFNGVNTFRGYRFEGNNSIRRGYYPSNPTITTGFQGSNQLGGGSTIIGNGQWSNTWPD